jgi:hypothetical protein
VTLDFWQDPLDPWRPGKGGQGFRGVFGPWKPTYRSDCPPEGNE